MLWPSVTSHTDHMTSCWWIVLCCCCICWLPVMWPRHLYQDQEQDIRAQTKTLVLRPRRQGPRPRPRHLYQDQEQGIRVQGQDQDIKWKSHYLHDWEILKSGMVDLFHQSSKREKQSKTVRLSAGYIIYTKQSAVSTLLATEVLSFILKLLEFSSRRRHKKCTSIISRSRHVWRLPIHVSWLTDWYLCVLCVL